MAQSNETIEVQVENLDKFLSGELPLDLGLTDPITAGLLGNRITSEIVQSGRFYKFAVQDGQTTFWKCVLEKHPIFTVIEREPESSFFAKTETFQSEVKKYSYNILEQKEVDQFLNFVNSPNGEPILETTAVNSEGEVFFKNFGSAF